MWGNSGNGLQRRKGTETLSKAERGTRPERIAARKTALKYGTRLKNTKRSVFVSFAKNKNAVNGLKEREKIISAVSVFLPRRND